MSRKLAAIHYALVLTVALAGVDARSLWAAEDEGAGVSFVFEGQVEPVRTVTVANRVDGVIDQVLFDGGEQVAQGDILFTIDSSTFEIAQERADASVAIAEAELRLALDAAAREAQLAQRGSGSRVRAFEAEAEADAARATLAARRADLRAASLDLERTQVIAPIAGRVSRPLVAPGAFVEAEAGSVLAEIVQLDPVLVGYGVPYAARTEALRASGSASVDVLLGRVDITLELPNGDRYSHAGTPRFESGAIDPATGMLTTWGSFPNPDGVLVPGLEVKVHAQVRSAADAR